MVPKKMRCEFFDSSGKDSHTIPRTGDQTTKKGISAKTSNPFILFLIYGAEGQNFNRLGRSNAPEAHKLPTRGFSDQIFKNSKSRDYKHLILFKFFILFLVSFGTIWKYLSLTGTIWAQ
jgi:hypothetical protein